MKTDRAPLATLVALAVTAIVASSPGEPPTFPHEKHARVFPVCEGCHAGIVSGTVDSVYPSYADCVRCHDGTRQPAISWRSARPRVSSLTFSHARHGEAVTNASDSTSCLTCHAVTDPPGRMSVAGPNPELCVGCHAHAGERHITPTAACRTCHVAITDAPGITAERIAAFPRPGWHDEDGFGAEHGRVATGQAVSCSVCHARETCERCHFNADRIPLITRLARDSRIAAMQLDRKATYPSPSSHQKDDWSRAHGVSALASIQACGNCHTRPSCDACHAGGTGRSRSMISALPGPGVEPGLGVDPATIDRAVHPADIVSRHGTLASSGSMACATCHAERLCADCHAAADSRRFHAANFVERHAVEVFASAADCQSCHNTERFCRDCHSSTGIAADGRMRAAFHTGKANWILSHGQAARTGMESCASCHRQNDCIRCHSASSGWGVNPHRAGFRANLRGEQNSASCRWCHVGALPGGGD